MSEDSEQVRHWTDRVNHWSLTRTEGKRNTFTLVIRGQVQSMFNEDEIPYVEVEVSKKTLLALRALYKDSDDILEEE